MSCILKEIASIQGLSELLCWLCPHLNTKNTDFSDGDDIETEDKESPSEVFHGWLDECLIAVSPTVNIMAIAARNRLAILTSRWEKNEHGEKKAILCVTWKGVVGHEQEGDEISHLACLPIISQKQSSSGAPDWTSIVVGFKSGFLSFYTENGLVLLTQLFDARPVLEISVRTYIARNFGACVYSDLSEELVVLYPKAIVSIDGFGLLQTLKACRNQLAKAAALGGADCPIGATLGYKKFSLAEQEDVSACVGVGMVPPHLYDYVMLMSNTRGFNQSMSGSVPTTKLLLSTGRAPFFASFSAKEGIGQPFMADVARQYASKLKNVLVSAASGWLFGNKEETSEKHKIQQPVAIPFRYTLPDRRRVGMSLQMSTSRRLATVTDDFGRVNVIDVQKCLVVRMFKGYRDAECGWVTISGDLGEAEREVPFLIIHAPRRNLLEVWLPQQGPRVAAFNVSKESKLLYTPHTLLGAHTQQGYSFASTPVVLINSRGYLERVSIPFHLALSGKTSKQARDVHLLKSVKSALRHKPADQILCLVSEVKTTAIKIQVLNLIANSKYVTVDLAKDILVQLAGKGEEPERTNLDTETNRVDRESLLLSQQLSRLHQLTQFYSLLSSLHPHSAETEHLTEVDIRKRFYSLMSLTEKELDLVLGNLKDPKLRSDKGRKVTFLTENLKFSSFLQCWDVSVWTVDKGAQNVIPIFLRKNLAKELEADLAQFIFGWPYNPDNLKAFRESLKPSGADESQLLHLNFTHWESLEEIDELATLRFFQQLLVLAIFCQPQLVRSNPSEEKQLWQMVREKLASWNQPLHAYLAAFVCRGIELATVRHESLIKDALQEAMDTDEPDSSSSLSHTSPHTPNTSSHISHKLLQALESSKGPYSIFDTVESWEEFSLEVVEWNLILSKLEVLVAVQKFYNVVMRAEGALVAVEAPEYSVKAFTLKGRGYLCELIARWLIEGKIPVEKIIAVIKKINPDPKAEEEENEPSSVIFCIAKPQPEQEKDLSLASIEDQFLELKSHFPESTNSDILLVNLSWEFAAAWKKSPNQLYYYDASIQALKNISNAFFIHGLSYMMWENWIGHYVQATTQLMEKLSRRPKDRVVMREVGISEYSLEKFFSLTKELLEKMIAGNLSCEVERPPIVGKDCFWKDLDSAPSLAEVMVAQKMTSCDLIFLHHQLVSVLTLIVRHELKNVKPYSLFPERDRAAFFKPLISSWRVTSDEGMEVVSSSQLTFLTRVVSAAVIALPDSQNNSDLGTPSGLYDSIEIGRSWGLALDAIRRHYICELYSSGLDAMAEQALIMVRDGVMIASQMVVIAGQRLRHLITTSPKSIQLIALMTPNVKEWCKSLEPGNLRCLDMPVRLTLKMTNRAVMLIPNSSRERKVASNLAMALDMINSSNVLES